MQNLLKMFERVVIGSLVFMMMIVVLLATLELGWLIVVDVITDPIVLLEIDELLDIFGFFLLVLIGVELLDTIRSYLSQHIVHVEIVIEVAMIAVARKVIILDVKDLSGVTLVGIAAIIVALTAAYFTLRRYRGWRSDNQA